MEQLLETVRTSTPRCGPVRVIAIDGGAAAGKSTLASRLAEALPGSAVLHLDDLLDGWDGQFGYRDRLHEQVLHPLAIGRPGRYRRYDWTAGRFGGPVELPVPNYLVIEGVSAIWGSSPNWSTAIFLDVPRQTRQRRWVERDGPMQPEWTAWLDAEDRFFAEHPIPGAAVVLRG